MTTIIARPKPRARTALRAMGVGAVAAFGAVPYAVVALVLRGVMARAVFLDGQGMIVGPRISLSLGGLQDTLTLPAQVRSETLSAFAAHFAGYPVSPAAMAYGLAYAAFVLPCCLVLGFATRVGALLLLVMTVVLQMDVDPGAFWSVHAYWISLLLVLMTLGGGALSLDRLIRQLYLK